jgi:hypothetical protein|tara:strand:+ start:428 stop:1036 length:609 start_codon:yes stop_codon:yes gene_type:complete
MYNDKNIVLVLLVIILIYCIYTSNKEGFKNIFNSNQFNQPNQLNINELSVLNENKNKHLVYDYLLTDGKLFYLYNSRNLVITGQNPLMFETLDEAEKFRKSTTTPPLNITNLLIKKTTDDPTENYERVCSKKISPFNSRVNTCFAYSNTEQDIEKNKELINDLSSGDHQLESCIIDLIGDENPDLKIENNNQKEIKFMKQFF